MGSIGTELGASSANAAQLVIPIYLLGTGLGQVMGTISDYLGRKPVIFAGVGIFAIGSLMCLFAQNFEWMLVGRFVQGIGAAAPRTVTQAMIRDRFSGTQMARVSSLMMGVFVLVPALAPALGQIIAEGFGWRSLFVFFLIHALLGALWLALRQPETHPAERRPTFSGAKLLASFKEAAFHPTVLRYTVVSGVMFGVFFAFISLFPQLFETVFGIGSDFTYYFAFLAASLGFAAITNASFVGRFGMRTMTKFAVSGCMVVTFTYIAALLAFDLATNLTAFLAWGLLYFYFQGVMMGNLAALVLEPLAHNAGMVSTIFGILSMIIAISIAAPISLAFDGTLFPLILSFLLSSSLALLLVLTDRALKLTKPQAE